jgi:lipopolysaccharide biosynthesis regulator YciM
MPGDGPGAAAHLRASRSATEIAQYHCELAEQCLRDGKADQARSHLLDAQAADPDCIRASLLQARMEMAAGDPETAALLYRRVASAGRAICRRCCPACWSAGGARARVHHRRTAGLFEAHPSPPLMLRLCDAIEAERGAAARGISGRLFERGMRTCRCRSGCWSCAQAQREPVPARTGVLDVVAHQLAQQPEYQCDHCGFEARELHWQCPSCKRWGSIKACEPDAITEPPMLRQRQIA